MDDDRAGDVAAISFGTDGWRAEESEFTVPRVRMVGQAVASYLGDEGLGGGTVAVGYDARETSRGYAEEVARVLSVNGFDVLFSERDVPTPLVATAVVDEELSGAVMITASHNPPEYNGVKFIPADGAPALPAVTDAIEANLVRPDPVSRGDWGSIRIVDFQPGHAERAQSLVGADLSGLTVVYDAMHGSGRGVTDALLEAAGAEVIRVRCTRDPSFGGVAPEPSSENLQSLVETVNDQDADLGVANDGDADRLAVVTPQRGVVDENLVFAVLYDYLLETDSGSAVRSVSTTFLIDRIAASHGESVIEVPVGFKWVAKAMADHDALIGGEESGGFSIRGHVREKDGVLMPLVVAAAAVEEAIDARIDALFAAHGSIHQGKVSVDCPDDQKQAVLTALGESLPETVAGRAVESVNDTDGFKIQLVDGAWVLVRPSGTEPKLRVYAEASSERAVETLLDAGIELIAANR